MMSADNDYGEMLKRLWKENPSLVKAIRKHAKLHKTLAKAMKARHDETCPCMVKVELGVSADFVIIDDPLNQEETP